MINPEKAKLYLFGLQHISYFVHQILTHTLTLVLSSSGSLSEHQPVQQLQNLQFYSMQHCGREDSRISANRESQLMGQSVRFNIGLCHHYESVELANVSVAIEMITPEKVNDTCLGFNTFHMTKICTRDSYTCKAIQYGR